jgi:hypothetical protein
VFKDKSGVTYAGQIRDGHACGLGVLDIGNGHKIYAEYGPYGEDDGRHLDRDGRVAGYILFERGRHNEEGWVVDARFGECEYSHEECARNDPRLLALIAHVAPVEALAKMPPPKRPRRPWRPFDVRSHHLLIWHCLRLEWKSATSTA